MSESCVRRIIWITLIACLSACVDSVIRRDHYGAIILVDLKPQAVDDLRQTVVVVAGLAGPRVIPAGAPNCVYYENKELAHTGAKVTVSACAGENRKSETGWGFWVTVITNHGRSLEVRGDVDTFITVIKEALSTKMKNARVTVEPLSFYLL